MALKMYQVIQYPEWSCPGMIYFVDENNKVVGNQQNPNNDLTQSWAEDGEDWGEFDPAEFKECVEIKRE